MTVVRRQAPPPAREFWHANRIDEFASPAQLPVGCPCRLRSLGLPCVSGGLDMRPPNAGLYSRHSIQAGEVLFRQGDRFRHIHAVRSGTFKSTFLMADGRDQVCSFQYVSDVVGFDGVSDGWHQLTVVALEDAQTCAFAYGPLMALAGQAWGVQHGLYRKMSGELARGKSHMFSLAHSNARDRMVNFLLDMSQRAGAQGRSPGELHLHMTRADIGSYLGMTLETVSRCLSAFKQMGYLEVECRRIRIIDLAGLLRKLGLRAG